MLLIYFFSIYHCPLAPYEILTFYKAMNLPLSGHQFGVERQCNRHIPTPWLRYASLNQNSLFLSTLSTIKIPQRKVNNWTLNIHVSVDTRHQRGIAVKSALLGISITHQLFLQTKNHAKTLQIPCLSIGY